jgi:hypothetical protein
MMNAVGAGCRYNYHVILGLDPRIHAASNGLADAVAGLAFRGRDGFLRPGVDGRVKPDHDDVIDVMSEDKADSCGTRPRYSVT